MEDLFEKIARKEIPSEVIYEDEDICAFLDIKPNNPGHTLVIPRKRYRNLLDTPVQILGKMMAVGKLVAEAQIKSLGAEGVNIVMNNEPAAGQIVFHAHLHIIPRFSGDGFKHWVGQSIPEKEMKEVADKLRAAI